MALGGAHRPGQAHDGPVFEHLLTRLKVDRRRGGRPRIRPDCVRAGRAYSSRATRAWLRRRGIGAVVPEPSDQIARRKRRSACGGRQTRVRRRGLQGRNVVERNFSVVKQWCGLATRYDSPSSTAAQRSHAPSRSGYRICQTRPSRPGVPTGG
ncbi:transposase [Mycobacterium intracellulare]|uniref:transposase n=1 Tax=Mycobacterium intracellulare TaxID=1767 RepID=UPI0009F38F96